MCIPVKKRGDGSLEKERPFSFANKEFAAIPQLLEWTLSWHKLLCFWAPKCLWTSLAVCYFPRRHKLKSDFIYMFIYMCICIYISVSSWVNAEDSPVLTYKARVSCHLLVGIVGWMKWMRIVYVPSERHNLVMERGHKQIRNRLYNLLDVDKWYGESSGAGRGMTGRSWSLKLSAQRVS